MDTIDNFDENVLESSVQTSNLIDVGIEAVDGLQHLKYSDDGDTSLEENETATNDEDVSLKEQMSENDNVLTHDGAHKIKAVNDCVIETSLNGTEESLPVIPSTAIISFEGCSIMPPDDNFLETTISNENLLKPSLDDENNSDMQDEEIQLRWDDDDVEEITFNSGIEEVYYNTAHFIKNKTSTGEGDDEAFSLQKVKIEEPHDMDVTNVEYLKDEDSELNESPKINLNFETEHQQDIETVENEIKDFAFDSLENKESSKVNLYSKDLEEFLILKQKPIGTGIDAANILEDIQLELSNDIKIDTVVAKDCHGLQEKKIDLVDEEKNIILEGIGLVESIDVNLDSNNTDNYNFYHNVKEKLTCDGDEGETPLKTVNTDTSNDKESNFEIEITKFSNNIIAKETNDDNMEINQLPKINLVNERPEEFNKISYCTKPLNDIEISMVKLGDDEQKQINNTIQYNNEKQNDTEDEVKGDLTESMKIPESTEIKWDNSPEYGAMEGTDTSEDKQPNELNDITYCAKPLNENEISMVNLGDDDEKQFNNTIQPKNTEDEVRGDSKESIKPQESTGINQGNSPDHGEIEKTSTSEKEVPHELNDFTYSTKSFNENEISLVKLGDDEQKQINNAIQYIHEKQNDTEDKVKGDSTESMKTPESTEINWGDSPKHRAMEGTSTSESEDKQPHELNDITYCTKPFNENEISIVNLGDDDEKQFDNTIQCINEIPKNTEDEVIGESTKSVKTQESTEMNCGISPKYGAIKGTSTSDTEDKQSHEKGAELNLSPKHSIKKIHTELSTEENITIVPTFKKQAGDDSALQDSIVDTSMGIVTQHGLKKPDMMLEIPTKELMNFMDEDDDNLDLLGNLEMSPDYAGVESAKLEDNIKEVNDPETVSTVPIISNNLDKEMNTVANMSEKIVDTRETSNENVNTDDNTAVKNQMVQLPNIPIVVDEPQPSTSKACMVLEMSRDSDEIGEVSDSLGLLAESSRVLEYDEEQDDDEDVDDDEDFDQDEESNQMLTEYSEESNTVHFESDMPKILQMESDNAQDGGEKENIERYDSEKETELCGFQIFEIKSDIPVNINENLIENNKQTECSLVIPKQEKTNVDENKEGMDDEMVPSPAVEQTTEKNLDAPPERLLSNTSDKEDENKTAKLPLENEDDADLKNNMSIGPPNDLAEVVEEKEKGEDDDVVLLDSSSDEDSCHSNEKSSSLSGVEPTVTSDDVSRCSLLTEVIEKPSSDSNLENSKLENRKIELTVTSEKKVTKTPTGLELFNVDSDDDETRPKSEHSELEECVWEDEEPRELTPCVNLNCNSKSDTQYYVADYEVCKFYQADHNGAVVCGPCADYVVKKSEEMIEAIRTFVPLLEMETGKLNKDLVEISDSDTDDDDGAENDGREKIGEIGAKFLEEKLGDMINETWVKFKMQSRFDDALLDLQKDLDVVNAEGEDLDGMLTECQQELDQIRTEFYATFNQERKDLPAIVIYDTPKLTYSSYEDVANSKAEPPQVRMKRRMSAVTDTPAKRLASLPALHYEDELDMTEYTPAASPESVDDDNVDVSVVDMSLETAPADLPPPGDYVKPLLRVGMTVYAMRTTYGLWTKAKIVELYPKTSWESSFTMCRVRFEHKVARNPFKFLPARCLAYSEPTEFRLIIATRIIASSDTTDTFYSGVVAEVPSPVNGYRYLVFFDDGHAKYVRHANTRLVCECSSLVWEEVHPNSREFVRNYLISYPERPMVRLHAGQNLKTEWNNQWWNSRVMQVDASLALIMLAGDRMEWIYRGSTRLAPLYLEMQAAERHRARPMPRSGHQYRTNMPYVEYTRYDEQQSVKAPAAATPQQNEEIRRQRAVAKKSLTTSQTVPPARPTPPANAANAANNMDSSRVVYYTPKNAVRPYKMVPHQCGPKCKRTDVLALKDLRTYNPLAKPLLSGWERQIVRFKGHREVMYRAPCGRRVRNMPELHRYLRAVRSDMSVDLFDFGPGTHCLAEFVINKCLVGKKDLSHGKENVPVPCVNYYDKTLPEFCSYNTERTPTAGVPLNLDPEFLCGCDCDDDCQDKNKCACWKMTLEGARTIGLNGDVGYVYRRLPEPLPSGIYECNSRCKCKNTCLNRVAQHPLQLKLQVFKTMNRGWGIRALNDVPKGAFLCVYAGNLLTDATANLDGLNEGDEYLAELDYIEVVEQMKEGYEDDIPDSLKEPDKSTSESTEEEESSSSGEEEAKVSKDEIDDDFQPGYIDVRPVEFNKRLRTRNRRKKEKQNNPDKDKDKDETQEKEKMKEEGEKENGEEDCITISDDEEVREPSRFMAQAGMDSKQLISKHRSVRSYFGKDEACYIMDAKVQGNIGRYLNHSCCPNVFVQNVFVDTHDPRFPWVAFFALSYIRAGTELTWNYNYDVGSVPGKVLYCYCGAVNCRGRLL